MFCFFNFGSNSNITVSLEVRETVSFVFLIRLSFFSQGCFYGYDKSDLPHWLTFAHKSLSTGCSHDNKKNFTLQSFSSCVILGSTFHLKLMFYCILCLLDNVMCPATLLIFQRENTNAQFIVHFFFPNWQFDVLWLSIVWYDVVPSEDRLRRSTWSKK